MVIVYLNVELFIDACDGELLMWNLTREICTRVAEDICAEYSREINWDWLY